MKTSNVKLVRWENFVHAGWSTLHESALNFGAEKDYWPGDYPKLKGERFIDDQLYRDLVSPFIEICDIDLDRFGGLADPIGRVIWDRFRLKASNKVGVWKFLSSERSGESIINEFKKSHWIKKISCTFNPLIISTIAKSAMSLLALYDVEKKEFESVVWGLALIGVVKSKFQQCECKFCFRRTWRGGLFCIHHSQSQTDEKTRSDCYMKYRIGSKAYELAKKKGLLKKIHQTPMMRSLNRQNFMVDMLFPSLHEENAHESEMLLFALQENPRVLNRIGGNKVLAYSYEKIVSLLRKNLDPEEFWDGALLLKIYAAEIWFNLEAEVAPGKRGFGKVASARIMEAQRLAKEGLKKSEIATRLGVSPSTISKWLKRRPEFVWPV